MNPDDANQLQQVHDNTVGNKNSHSAGAWGEGVLLLRKKIEEGSTLMDSSALKQAKTCVTVLCITEISTISVTS